LISFFSAKFQFLTSDKRGFFGESALNPRLHLHLPQVQVLLFISGEFDLIL
jgi:hypothetical protein